MRQRARTAAIRSPAAAKPESIRRGHSPAEFQFHSRILAAAWIGSWPEVSWHCDDRRASRPAAGRARTRGNAPMATAATATTYGTAMSAADHSAQLRKAVIASTIGTTIEWYDFFLYGTAAGLIFGKLYFPNEDPL